MTWYPGQGSPDLDDLQGLKRELEGYYSARNTRMAQDERYFFLTYDTRVPTGYTDLKPPTGQDVVKQIIAHMLAEMPIIRVPRRDENEREQLRAEKLTAWLNAAWHRLDGQRLLAKLLWYGLVRGPMVLRTIPDPSFPQPPEAPGPEPEMPMDAMFNQDVAKTWGQNMRTWLEDRDRYQDRKEHWENDTRERAPLLLDPIDPMHCFPEPGDRPRFAIISWRRRASEVREVWGEDVLLGMTPSQELVWNEFWSDTYYAYWAETYGRYSVGSRRTGKETWILEPRQHHYGCLPIIIDGAYETPLSAPEKKYLSIYNAVGDMIRQEAESFSQRATMIERLAWALLILKTERQRTMKFDRTPGVTNYLYPDESAEYLVPQIPDALLQLQQFQAQQYIERSTIQGVLTGQVRARSGYLQAQVAALAKVIFVPIELACSRVMQQANRNMLRLVETTIKRPVHLWGWKGQEPVDASIGPSDIRGYYRNTVEFRTIRPVDESARLANIQRLQQMGISGLKALEMAGIESPEAERVRRDAEELFRHPLIAQARAIRAARMWGLTDELAVLQALQAAEQAQQSAGPAGPGMPAPPASEPPFPPEEGSAGEMSEAVRQAAQGPAQPRRLPAGGMAR